MAAAVRPLPWARLSFALAFAGALLLAALAASGRPTPGWGVAAVVAGLLGSVAAGVFLLPAGLFARPVLGADPGRSAGRLALTFDDGPDPEHTRAVMDLLESRGHRGTFFLIGARAAERPELAAEIARRGHGLGNHSWDHAWTTPVLSIDRLLAELERAQGVLEAAAGKRPRWFRPPVGLLSPRVAAAARRAGLEIVGWTASGRDGARRATPERAAARLCKALRPGAILVLHDAVERPQGDRVPLGAAALRLLLTDLDQRGLRSVPLDELLAVT